MTREIAPPAAEALRDLYVDQKLTQLEIAERYNVHQTMVSRWILAAGLSRRRPKQPPPPPPAAAFIPDPAPFPTPGKRGTPQRQHRPYLRLTEQQRKLVNQRIDLFLIHIEMRKA